MRARHKQPNGDQEVAVIRSGFHTPDWLNESVCHGDLLQKKVPRKGRKKNGYARKHLP